MVVIFFDKLQRDMFEFQFLIFSRIKYNASIGEIKFHHISVVYSKLFTYLHYLELYDVTNVRLMSIHLNDHLFSTLNIYNVINLS